jgi:hypothetical protein
MVLIKDNLLINNSTIRKRHKFTTLIIPIQSPLKVIFHNGFSGAFLNLARLRVWINFCFYINLYFFKQKNKPTW